MKYNCRDLLELWTMRDPLFPCNVISLSQTKASSSVSVRTSLLPKPLHLFQQFTFS